MAVGFLPKLAIALLAGGLLGLAGSVPAPSIHAGILFALFFLLAAISHFQKKFREALWIFILTSAVIFGFFLSRQSIEQEEEIYAQQFGPVSRLSVRILSDPYLERRALVELIESPHRGLRMILSLRSSGGKDVPAYGQTVRVNGIANGRYLTLYSWEPDEGEVAALTPFEQFHFLCLRLRDRMDRTLQTAGMPEGFLAFARAELFGKRAGLDERTLRALQENGLTHIIAVSGMHTTLLAAAVFFLLAPLLGREAATLMTVGAVFTFCLMVGLQPSVVRASICTALALLGSLLQRPVRILNILAAAFIVEWMIFPEHLRHAGFQLSYLSVLAIGLSAAVLKPVLRPSGENPVPTPAWLKLILPTLIIQIFTAPLGAYLFYRWSPISLLSNILFLPVFTFLIALAAAVALLSLVWPAMAAWLGWVGDVFLQVTLRVVADVPEFFSISSHYGRLPLWGLILFLTAWIVFLCLSPRKPKYWLAGGAAFLLILSSFPALRNRLEPFSVLMGGRRSPYVVIKEGSFAHYVSITTPGQGEPHGVPQDLLRELLKEGVDKIGHLNAGEAENTILAREFGIEADDRRLDEFTQWEDGGFQLRQGRLTLLYLKERGGPQSARDWPKPSNPPDGLLWLGLEPPAAKILRLPVDFNPNSVYISGTVLPDQLKSWMAEFEEKGVPNILAAAVDGRAKLWLDLRQRWHISTELMESLE